MLNVYFFCKMVRDFHVTEEKNVGYYVGFITSCFALSQLLTSTLNDAILVYQFNLRIIF